MTGLVEWPAVMIGAIDSAFMDLPSEVLTTSMRTHQKYFSCLDRDGRLAPRFLLVANNVADDGGKTIVDGNERVLRARLSDARFFWDQDRKIKLENRLPKLAERVFYQNLGTMADKAMRLAQLSTEIAHQIARAKPNLLAANSPAAQRQARRTIRQGRSGERDGRRIPRTARHHGPLLRRGEGERGDVAYAIAEHYSPLGPSDRCPTEPLSVAVALADKLDTLVGFFMIGEKPTGSKDPYRVAPGRARGHPPHPGERTADVAAPGAAQCLDLVDRDARRWRGASSR